MSDLRDYLNKRATELGLERGPQLEAIQAHLDKLYPGQSRAASIHNGALKIITPTASLASELRLRQVELLAAWADHGVVRLVIQVG